MKKTYEIEVDCANCAQLMEQAASKVEGIASVTVTASWLYIVCLLISMLDCAETVFQKAVW